MHGYPVSLAAVERLREEVDVGLEASLGAGYTSGAAELDPGHREDRARVAVREGQHVFLVVLMQIDAASADVVHAYAQAQELALRPDVRAEAYALRDVLGVEGAYCGTARREVLMLV